MTYKKYLIASYFSYVNQRTGERTRVKLYSINTGYLLKKFENKYEMRIYLSLNGLKIGKRTSMPPLPMAKCNILEFELI